jgi:ribosomal-protein-alanine N-acetyltransferase
VIRQLVAEDAAELARLLHANRSFLAPFEPEHDEDFFTAEGQRARIEAAEHYYAIVDGEELARGPFQSAHVGYWVDDASNGRGLASSALADLVEHAFTELGLHRIEAATLVDNGGSQRVLEKNGFTRIGIAPRYLRIAGAWRDHVLFQRTIED